MASQLSFMVSHLLHELSCSLFVPPGMVPGAPLIDKTGRAVLGYPPAENEALPAHHKAKPQKHATRNEITPARL